MRVMIAIPAYNEAETVAGVVREVRSHRPDDAIVVIDDGSQDDTAAQAAGATTVLRLPFNAGVGAAMRTAFVYAARQDYDVVVQVDADGQHDPAGIDALLEALDPASVVVGARGDTYADRGPRRWARRFLAAAVSRMVGTPLTDVTSGFRAADRRAIALFARDYPSEYLGDTVQSLVIAAKSGLLIAQTDVVMRARRGGQASHGRVRSTAHVSRALLALVVAASRKEAPS